MASAVKDGGPPLTHYEEDTLQLRYESVRLSGDVESCLRDEFTRINDTLSDLNRGWKDRIAALKRLCGIIQGLKESDDLSLIWDVLSDTRDGLAISLSDLRSAVVKEACWALCYLSSRDHSRCHLTSLLDYLVPNLMKLMVVSTMIMSHSANLTLRRVLKHTVLNRGLAQFVTSFADRNDSMRVRSLEFLELSMEVHTHRFENPHLHSHLESISKCVLRGISDASESVRLVARRCVWALSAVNESRAQWIIDQLDSSNHRRVMDERLHYQPFPPAIGKGHQTSAAQTKARKGFGRGLRRTLPGSRATISQSTASLGGGVRPTGSSFASRGAGSSRPRSALPSRRDRLALLRKRKQERPVTAVSSGVVSERSETSPTATVIDIDTSVFSVPRSKQKGDSASSSHGQSSSDGSRTKKLMVRRVTKKAAEMQPLRGITDDNHHQSDVDLSISGASWGPQRVSLVSGLDSSSDLKDRNGDSMRMDDDRFGYVTRVARQSFVAEDTPGLLDEIEDCDAEMTDRSSPSTDTSATVSAAATAQGVSQSPRKHDDCADTTGVDSGIPLDKCDDPSTVPSVHSAELPSEEQQASSSHSSEFASKQDELDRARFQKWEQLTSQMKKDDPRMFADYLASSMSDSKGSSTTGFVSASVRLPRRNPRNYFQSTSKSNVSGAPGSASSSGSFSSSSLMADDRSSDSSCSFTMMSKLSTSMPDSLNHAPDVSFGGPIKKKRRTRAASFGAMVEVVSFRALDTVLWRIERMDVASVKQLAQMIANDRCDLLNSDPLSTSKAICDSLKKHLSLLCENGSDAVLKDCFEPICKCLCAVIGHRSFMMMIEDTDSNNHMMDVVFELMSDYFALFTMNDTDYTRVCHLSTSQLSRFLFANGEKYPFSRLMQYLMKNTTVNGNDDEKRGINNTDRSRVLVKTMPIWLRFIIDYLSSVLVSEDDEEEDEDRHHSSVKCRMDEHIAESLIRYLCAVIRELNALMVADPAMLTRCLGESFVSLKSSVKSLMSLFFQLCDDDKNESIDLKSIFTDDRLQTLLTVIPEDDCELRRRLYDYHSDLSGSLQSSFPLIPSSESQSRYHPPPPSAGSSQSSGNGTGSVTSMMMMAVDSEEHGFLSSSEIGKTDHNDDNDHRRPFAKRMLSQDDVTLLQSVGKPMTRVPRRMQRVTTPPMSMYTPTPFATKRRPRTGAAGVFNSRVSKDNHSSVDVMTSSLSRAHTFDGWSTVKHDEDNDEEQTHLNLLSKMREFGASLDSKMTSKHDDDDTVVAIHDECDKENHDSNVSKEKSMHRPISIVGDKSDESATSKPLSAVHVFLDDNCDIYARKCAAKSIAHCLSERQTAGMATAVGCSVPSSDQMITVSMDEVLSHSQEIVHECCSLLMSKEEGSLHRNVLRVIQALCWYNYGELLLSEWSMVLDALLCCFDKEALPSHTSGVSTQSKGRSNDQMFIDVSEFALDVSSQLAKYLGHYFDRCQKCLTVLLTKIEKSEESSSVSKDVSKRVSVLLNIVNRMMVRMPIVWLNEQKQRICQVLLKQYERGHKEAMRSLVYLTIVINDVSFLNDYPRAQKIVESTMNHDLFKNWVSDHRQLCLLSS